MFLRKDFHCSPSFLLYLCSAVLLQEALMILQSGLIYPLHTVAMYTVFTIHLGAHENVLISCNIRKVSNMSLDYIHPHTITLKQKEKNEREKRGGGRGRGKEKNWWKKGLVKTKMFRVHKVIMSPAPNFSHSFPWLSSTHHLRLSWGWGQLLQ